MAISTAISKTLTKGTVKASSFLGKVSFCILKGIKDGVKEAYNEQKTLKEKETRK